MPTEWTDGVSTESTDAASTVRTADGRSAVLGFPGGGRPRWPAVRPQPMTEVPPVPPAEDARLRALEAYRILDTGPEAPFDALARIAALICGTPIALVNLIDRDRGWFKARVGTGLTEIPRDLALCARTITGQALLEVPDAREDPRFGANPLVTGEPPLR